MCLRVALWIDHQQARLFRVRGTKVEEQMLAAQSPHHRSAKGPRETKPHPEDAQRFFAGVAQALEGAEEILIMGPSSAKHELVRYLGVHAKLVSNKIVGVEVVDHPTDKHVIELANRHFRRDDATL